jgi:hypothetical protein
MRGKKSLNIGMNRAKHVAHRADKRDQLAVQETLDLQRAAELVLTRLAEYDERIRHATCPPPSPYHLGNL